MGLTVYAIPGNHDLESKDATALTNGADALSAVGVNMINKSTEIVTPDGDCLMMVPWFDNIEQKSPPTNKEQDR